MGYRGCRRPRLELPPPAKAAFRVASCRLLSSVSVLRRKNGGTLDVPGNEATAAATPGARFPFPSNGGKLRRGAVTQTTGGSHDGWPGRTTPCGRFRSMRSVHDFVCRPAADRAERA